MAHVFGKDSKRSTNVISKTDVKLIELNPDVLALASASCRFQFAEAFSRILARRLALANTRLSHLLSDELEE